MKTHTREAVKTALPIALPLTIFIVSYFVYNQSPAGALTDASVRYGDTNLSAKDSVKLAKIQASIDKELDSLERNPPQEWLDNYYTGILSQSKQDSSLIARHNADSVQNNKRRIGVLDGPSAFLSRRYSLRVGKPVLVNILWAPDSSFSPVKLELITITLNDVADEKAGFTLADSSGILLYSEARYAVNDNISIEDKDHNLHISVLQVHPDSASIELTSHLTDEIVSRLKGWD